MFLSAYRFQGEPAHLLAAHTRLLKLVPLSNLTLHAAVPHAGGLDVYDSCPTRAVAESFAASEGFAQALAQAGLPQPRFEPLGDIRCLVVQGAHVVAGATS
jgi:hypothetical protein